MTQESNVPLDTIKGIETIVVNQKNEVLFERCSRFEYDVFLNPFLDQPNIHFIEPEVEGRITKYDRYADHTEFLVAIESGNARCDSMDILGVVRLVYAPKDSRKMQAGIFPTMDARDEINIFPEAYEKLMQYDPRRIVDIVTVSTSPAVRLNKDRRPSKALIKRIMTRGWEQPPLRFAFGMNDRKYHEKQVSRGIKWDEISPFTMYMGSETIAVFMDSFRLPQGVQKLAIPIYRSKGYLNRLLNKND